MSMSLVGINQMHGENVSDLDAIIAELNREYDGKLPEQALRAAQRHRAEITPRLIELIRQSTHAVRAGNSCAGNGQLFALFLEDLLENAPEAADLALRALPVFQGEGVERQHLDAELDAAFDHLADRAAAGAVAHETRHAAALRPAAVPVHDDGDVFRNRTP